jgi:ABC-2 type transport system permease protein
MNPRHIMVVIRREYVERVRTKAFVLSTIGVPLFLIGVVVLPSLLAGRGMERRRTVAVLDQTGVLYERVAPRLEEASFVVADLPDAAMNRDSLDARVSGGELGGYLVLDQETITRARMTYRGEEGPSAIRTIGLQRAVMEAALETRLEGTAQGSEVRDFIRGGSLEVEIVGQAGVEDEVAEMERERGRILALAGTFVLYFVIIIYGTAVMRAVLEEKRDRIVEIIISSVRPSELMMGKIFGVGAVGLTQFLIWVLSAVLILGSGIPFLAAMLPMGEDGLGLARFMPSPGIVILMVVFFLLGYFLYSALYAAVGAMVSSDEEAQQTQVPVTILVVVAFFLTFRVADGGPADTLTLIGSQVPFFSPIVMFARAAQGTASPIEIGLSILILVITIPAVAWVVGRIYRVGILMQGKRPTFPELVRWIRQA